MIKEILYTGKENARRGRDLCEQLGINPRELTAAIERERKSGAPICASCNGNKPGYYLAATQEEMQIYCRSLYKRAGEIHKTRRACLKALKRLPTEAAQ